MESPRAQFSEEEVEREARRLYEKMFRVQWNMDTCRIYAPLTLEINQLKREKDAVILAHSYQTPDIIYGVADFVGDSYGLGLEASRTTASTIVFCGVRFMAETAKILNPGKRVLLPAPDAGCSLSESITAEDVRKLRKENPGASIVCYVNTGAAVKAECDAVCTSANALKVVEAMPSQNVVFLPDQFMAQNLAAQTKKEIVGWKGKCVVHEQFTAEKIKAVRLQYPKSKILVHTECAPDIVSLADLAGGTTDMVRYAKTSDAKQFVMVTECGLSDRMRVELPEKEFVSACNLCPYMKRVTLEKVRQALQQPTREHVIEIPEGVRVRAKRALERMLEIGS